MRLQGPLPRTITAIHLLNVTVEKAKRPVKHAAVREIAVSRYAPINLVPNDWRREELLASAAYAVANSHFERITDVFFTVEGY